MKSSTRRPNSMLARAISPVTAIIVAVVVVALVGGIYTFSSYQREKAKNAKFLKGFETIETLTKLSQERWQKELAAAKAENRPPNERFRPGPNMDPINGIAPLRMGPGVARSPGPAQTTTK